MGSLRSAKKRRLRPGDVVEVRPIVEILETLDADASLARMPFMPEMIRHAGRRYRVSRRVDKICDTIAYTGSRRMGDTVYLEDLRCDGSGHGGCQAGCRLYWKEAWLRRINDQSLPIDKSEVDTVKLQQLVQAGTRTVWKAKGTNSEVWRCQATEALGASDRLKVYDLRQYWRELTNGNFGPLRLIFLLARGFVMEIAYRAGLLKPLPLSGRGSKTTPRDPLNLKRGDLVEVRSPTEIASTLDDAGFSDGLSFDSEMLPYCGRTFRVKDSVSQIIDERTGRMLTIRKDSIILDGVVCSGCRSVGRWLCPREIYPFWREAWLRKVDEPTSR